MISALAVGVMFGLTAGFAPGPLMTLVITQTVQHNTREGALVASAPLVTDVPIVLAAVLLVNQVATLAPLLGILACAGGFYVIYLAYETSRTAPVVAESGAAGPRSIRKAILFWVASAKREDTRRRRITKIVEAAARGEPPVG